MNLRRYRAVWRLIERFPSQYKQDEWHCGTSHCVAGWADIVAAGYKRPELVNIPRSTGSIFCLGMPAKFRAWVIRSRRLKKLFDTKERAASWLKLADRERDYLFAYCRTRDELRAVAETGKFPWELPS